MMQQMQAYLRSLKEGRDLDVGTIRHVAGCLNWYSEVLQSGRARLRTWWLYCRFRNQLSVALRVLLLEDTQWWIAVLKVWSEGNVSEREYLIMSTEELLSQPNRIWVLQSDASGPHGFGYLQGGLNDENPEYFSKVWDTDYLFHSSHDGELQALKHFVEGTLIRDKFLVWISDSLAAVWSINKGRSHTLISLDTIEKILGGCDSKGLLLVGLWVPREYNQTADYLSHLSFVLNRSENQGSLSGL